MAVILAYNGQTLIAGVPGISPGQIFSRFAPPSPTVVGAGFILPLLRVKARDILYTSQGERLKINDSGRKYRLFHTSISRSANAALYPCQAQQYLFAWTLHCKGIYVPPQGDGTRKRNGVGKLQVILEKFFHSLKYQHRANFGFPLNQGSNHFGASAGQDQLKGTKLLLVHI